MVKLHVSFLAVCGFYGPVFAQDSVHDEVTLRVSSVEESAIWFQSVFGFESEDADHRDDRETRHLRRDEALLVLEEGGEAGSSAVIKLGLLIPGVEDVFEGLRERYPESVLAAYSELPAVPEPSDWPVAHFIAVHPDGTLIQALGQEHETRVARWFLAAVTVRSLDEAAEWYSEEAGFVEVLRPDAGDPRNLMRLGSFYLELGEFGGSHTALSGVAALRLAAHRAEGECKEQVTPQGYLLRTCLGDPDR